MPTETRQLVFTNEEVMAAMTSHNRIAAEKLFVGSIVQCRLAADPKVSLHLTIRHETTRNTYDLVFGPDALEPALIRYCLELNIPLLQDVALAEVLEVSIASRYSDYSNFGDTQNPKFGFRWKPFADLLDGANPCRDRCCRSAPRRGCSRPAAPARRAPPTTASCSPPSR